MFAGQGVWGGGHPEMSVRFDLTPQGFHAMILGEGETVYIDPYRPNERETVIVYTRSDFYATTKSSKKMKGCMALDAPGQKPQSVTKDIQGGKKVNMMGGQWHREACRTTVPTFEHTVWHLRVLGNTPNFMEGRSPVSSPQ